MQDPERLLSVASETDPLEREVLTALRRAKAPAHAKAAAWGGVAAGIAAATLPATASGTAAASATSSAGAKAALGVGGKLMLAGATKAALAATLATVALGGAYVYHQQVAVRSAARVERAQPPRRSGAPPSPSITSPLPAKLETPLATTPEPAQPVLVAPPPPPPASAPRVSAKSKTSDLLAEESVLLGTARSQLRNGDARGADATLARLRQRFPKGALRQERQVLAIEVLAARGDIDAARQKARAFVQRYPNSPHSTPLRLLLTAP